MIQYSTVHPYSLPSRLDMLMIKLTGNPNFVYSRRREQDNVQECFVLAIDLYSMSAPKNITL